MELKSRLIYFVGIDGSGKTTLAKKLCDELGSKGFRVSLVWLRMNYLFTKPLLLLCRILGLTKRPVVDGRKISVHEFYRSPMIASLVRGLHAFDTFLHYVVKIYLPLKFTNKVIVCDRFIYDVFIDFSVEGRKANIFDSLLFRVCNRLMLRDAATLLICTPREHILERRPDVLQYDPDYACREKLFQDLSQRKDVLLIHNTQSLDFAYRQITTAIAKH